MYNKNVNNKKNTINLITERQIATNSDSKKLYINVLKLTSITYVSSISCRTVTNIRPVTRSTISTAWGTNCCKKKHQQNDLTLMTETYPTSSLYLLKLQVVQTALK